MKRSTFLTIAGIIGLLLGAISLFLPHKMAEGFGMVASPVIVFLIRDLGVLNLSVAGMNLAVRNHQDSPSLKAILGLNGVYHLLMLPMNVSAYMGGIFGIGQMALPFTFHLLIGLGSFYYWSKIKKAGS